MPAGEHAYEHPVDGILLSNDNLANFLADLVETSSGLLYFMINRR